MAWALTRRQHSVVAHRQLRELGFTNEAIQHRIERGRLHCLYRGVYAVGRREISCDGALMAAALACGDQAVLSHGSAAELWAIVRRERAVHVTVPAGRQPAPRGITVHRRATTEATLVRSIPVTSLTRTLLDIATNITEERLERVLNEAMNRDLTTPESLRAGLDDRRGQPGVAPLKQLLDRHAFDATDTVLEQRMLAIAREIGMPRPVTQAYVNGYRVDFFWPDLGIVVEADSLRFHRTPAQQTADRLRDQAHLRAGLVPLRFTHWQVCRDPGPVGATLLAVAQRAQRRLCA